MDAANRRYVVEGYLATISRFRREQITAGENVLTSTRPQLPALSYLDVDKVKREEDSYQTRNIGGAAPSPYPSGPPPPYSHPPPTSHLANSWSSVQSGVRTPPESRRTSGEQEDAKHATRQSLPSISEALGVDSQTSYSAPTPAPPSASAHQSHQTPVPPSSPKRSYGMEPPPVPHSSYTSNGGYSDYPQYRETPRPHSYAPQEPSRAAYAPERPPLHLQTSQAPPPSHSQPSAYNYPTSTSPGYDHPSNSSAGSMPPPSVPYGYQPYPPRYAQPTPPSSVNGGPIYQPSANYPAPSTPNSSWKTESSRYGEPRSITSADYSSSVKRHLDMFDLEGALNDVGITCGSFKLYVLTWRRFLNLAASWSISLVGTGIACTKRHALVPPLLLSLALSRSTT